MTAPHHLREALGLTQEETAMILKIPVSQLAMFEVGQRDLPTGAKLKLATMYHYVQEKQQEKSGHPVLIAEEAEMEKLLKEELIAIQHEQSVIERKIIAMKSRYQKSVSILQLVEYLEKLPKEEKYEKEFSEILRRKALKGIEKCGPAMQIKWSLKLSTLQIYQKELKEYKVNFIP
jgi:hypothetical protein